MSVDYMIDYRIVKEFCGSLFLFYVVLAVGNPYATSAALFVATKLTDLKPECLFNPAVTIMMTGAGKINVADVVPYITAQVLGGLVALELYKRVQIK